MKWSFTDREQRGKVVCLRSLSWELNRNQDWSQAVSALHCLLLCRPVRWKQRKREEAGSSEEMQLSLLQNLESQESRAKQSEATWTQGQLHWSALVWEALRCKTSAFPSSRGPHWWSDWWIDCQGHTRPSLSSALPAWKNGYLGWFSEAPMEEPKPQGKNVCAFLDLCL